MRPLPHPASAPKLKSGRGLIPQGHPSLYFWDVVMGGREDARSAASRGKLFSYDHAANAACFRYKKLFFSYAHGRTQLRNLRHLHGHVSLCVKEWHTVQIRKTVFRTGPVSHRWPHRCGEAITSVIRYAPGTHAPDAPSTGGASAAPALQSASAGCWPAPRVRTRPAPQPRGPASRRPRRPRPASRSRGCTG